MPNVIFLPPSIVDICWPMTIVIIKSIISKMNWITNGRIHPSIALYTVNIPVMGPNMPITNPLAKFMVLGLTKRHSGVAKLIML